MVSVGDVCSLPERGPTIDGGLAIPVSVMSCWESSD